MFEIDVVLDVTAASCAGSLVFFVCIVYSEVEALEIAENCIKVFVLKLIAWVLQPFLMVGLL